MSFTESDRVKIRKYMGAGSVFKQLFPKLENAITAVQSTTDGGSQTDNSTELSILSIITKLETIETKIEGLYCQVQVVEVNKKEVVLNTAQGLYLLRSEGRRMIGVLSRTLACAPLYDYFSGQQPCANDFANPYSVV
jgi:hypothetical protein